MAEMVRYGLLANPYTPGVMIDFYGNPLGGAGSGWPTVNGAGPGNLVAETATSDTVGYNFTDRGTGGIHISATGTVDNEGIELLYSGAAVAENGGIALVDNSAVSAGISLVVNDTDNPGGIALTSQGTGGVNLTDNGSGGVNLFATGSAGGQFGASGGGPLNLYVGGGSGDLLVQAVAGSSGDIYLHQQGSGAIKLITSGTDIEINPNEGALGFFGTGTTRQSSSGITTVAQLVTVLKEYGLLS